VTPFEKRDYYDAHGWGSVARTGECYHRETVALGLLEPILRGDVRFLDVGCGEGSFLVAARRVAPGARLVGLDISEHQLAKAHALLPEARFIRCNLDGGIPLPDDAVDAAYAGEVIEHLHDPDRLVRECLRVVRPGGLLVVTTPNLCAWYNRLLVLVGTQPLFVEMSTTSTLVGAGPTRRFRTGSYPVGHIRIFTMRALTDLLELHGFTVEVKRAAVFEAFTGPLRAVDRALATLPTLGSICVVRARVPQTGSTAEAVDPGLGREHGGACGIRTRDLSLAKRALSQLS
jgi:SAM-dependent methyltransferase